MRTNTPMTLWQRAGLETLWALCCGFALLPYWFRYYVVENIVFFILFCCLRYRMKVVTENLRNSFPEKSEAERRRIRRRFYRTLAEEHNPLLGTVSLKRQLAEEGVKVKRAEFLPQIVAMGGGSFYNYQVSGIVPRWAVGIGIRIKLFDGLQRERNYAAARQTVLQVGELEREAATGIAMLVEQRYNELANFRSRIASLEHALSFAEEYLRMKEIAFREGIAPSSEVIDAELNLAAIRTERLQAAYGFDLALARLLETTGAADCYASYLRRRDARPVLFDR